MLTRLPPPSSASIADMGVIPALTPQCAQLVLQANLKSATGALTNVLSRAIFQLLRLLLSVNPVLPSAAPAQDLLKRNASHANPRWDLSSSLA